MSDETMRELERRARTGDPDAARALSLARERVRAGVAAKPLSKLKKAQREAVTAAVAAVAADDLARLRELLPGLVEHAVLDHPGAVVGTGPLVHYALAQRRSSAARLLLEAGADIEAPDFRKGTPLMRAICFCPDLVTFVLDLGADVHARSTYRQTALHFAAGGSTRAIELLLDRGADVDAQDSSGRTPLHVAASGAYLEEVRLLLARGADPDARWGGERLTPLEHLTLVMQDPSAKWGAVPLERRQDVEATLACLRSAGASRRPGPGATGPATGSTSPPLPPP